MSNTDSSAAADHTRSARETKRLAALRMQAGDFDAAITLFSQYLENNPLDAGVLRTVGHLMAVQGDHSEAQGCLERALAIDPADSASHETLANIHLAMGRHEEAMAGYQAALEIDQSLSGAHSKLGAMLYAQGEMGDARLHLEKALEIDGTDADAHNNLGNVLLSEDHPTHAIEHYEKASAINPNWPPPRRNRGRALTDLGRNQDAIAAFREALHLEPGDQEAARGLADALVTGNQTDEAIDILKTAREGAPGDVATLFALGVNYGAQSRWEDAVTVLEEASSLVRGSSDVLNNLAMAYLELERYDDTIETANAAIAADTTHGLAHNTLASGYIGKKMPNEALQSCDRALQLDPAFFAAAYNRGLALRRLGRTEEARRQYEAARKMSPDSHEVHGRLAMLHREIGDFEKAEEYYRQAIALARNHDDHAYHLATLLQSQGRPDDLVTTGRQMVADRPEFLPGYVLQAMGLTLLKRHSDAESILLKGLEFDPNNSQCLIVLASQYHALGRLEEAAVVYERILERTPDNPKILSQLVDVNLSQCNWKGYEKFSRDLIDRVKSDIASGTKLSVDVFSLQALPLDYAFIAEAARNKAKAVSDEQAWARSGSDFSFRPHNRKKIRIGYVLAYTWFHSLPMVLKNVIEQHDRDRFEVYGYSLRRADDSEFNQSYRQAFDRFRDIEEDFPDSAARCVYQDDLDILIDVAGQTAINCMPMLSFRPAPIQAHYLGYSITTGADYIDYLITDSIYIPETLQEHCSEALVRLPNTFMATTRAPISAEPTCRADHDLPEDAFVLCNFNHPCKFEPEIFGAWMRIMTRLPNSVLWLGDWSSATRRNLCREAEDRDVSADRLIFSKIIAHADHCARLRLADIAVDPRYHGGGITTVDALWSGVPVVTICGNTPSSRLGATLLNAAQLPETITYSVAEYENLVVALAQDQGRLKKLRDKLWEGRLTCPLFDTERYVRGLERAYEAMWNTYRAGEAPHPISIPREN